MDKTEDTYLDCENCGEHSIRKKCNKNQIFNGVYTYRDLCEFCCNEMHYLVFKTIECIDIYCFANEPEKFIPLVIQYIKQSYDWTKYNKDLIFERLPVKFQTTELKLLLKLN